ncbi:ABC transporter permease [Agromyces humi]|uniref:ABC transporter permease n=1 Tax=Agromyces humi TaxID=1766800 RepID=UPI001F3EDD29|nr:FtsX-like permease family protein [Agromyces humi]
MRNAAFPGGSRVPLRLAYGADWSIFGLPATLPADTSVAFGSAAALEQLGMPEPVGGVETIDGVGYAVAGSLTVPEHLAFLEPVLIAPQPAGTDRPVSTLVVIAERPDLVAPVAAAIGGILAVTDPSKVSVQTSEDLASLRAIIEGQLGSFGQTLTIGILALTGLLAAAILYGIVMMRRKDYGRRRALGASQRLIVSMLLIQTAVLAAVGAVAGSTVGAAILLAGGDPMPGLAYVGGVSILAVVVAIIASLVPAVVASRREPISELRVP